MLVMKKTRKNPKDTDSVTNSYSLRKAWEKSNTKRHFLWMEGRILCKRSYVKHSLYYPLYICLRKSRLEDFDDEALLDGDGFLKDSRESRRENDTPASVSCTRDVLPTSGLQETLNHGNQSVSESPPPGSLSEERDEIVSKYSNLRSWHWSPLSLIK